MMALAVFITGTDTSARAQEKIKLTVREVVRNDALFYRGAGKAAAVLAHQSGASMESWHEFATALQQRGIASLSLRRVTADDVTAGINYLKAAGYADISLIGASLGGGAIMQTLSRGDWPQVRRVVMLAPASGPALMSATRDKLFLIAKADFFKSNAYAGYEEAVEPKTLLEFEGRDHGQALLEGAHGETAVSAIMEFLAR